MGSALVCSSTRDSVVVAHKQEHSESQLETSYSLQSQPQLPAFVKNQGNRTIQFYICTFR